MQKFFGLFRLRLLLLVGATGLLLPWAAIAASPQAVTLAPHITELIFAAGAGGQIKATVQSSDYPPEAKNIARVGDGVRINTEILLSMRPDIVIAWQDMQAVQGLRPVLNAAGIPLDFSTPRSLDEIPQEILRFGEMFHTLPHAERNARALQLRINALRDKYAQRSLLRVYIDLGSEPLYTIGNDPLMNHVLAICRSVNVYASAAVAAPLVSLEHVLLQQPDALIIASPSKQLTMSRLKYWKGASLSAARRHHAYAIHPDLLFRPGPRLIDAAESLCRELDQARPQYISGTN